MHGTHLTQRPAIAILTDTLEVEDSIHAMAVLARRRAIFPDAVVDLCARVAATQAVQPLADLCRRLSPPSLISLVVSVDVKHHVY